MPKAFIFWALWLLCLLALFGVFAMSWNLTFATPVVVLILTGLMGWQVFGKPIQ
jgi:hypothetical protein